MPKILTPLRMRGPRSVRRAPGTRPVSSGEPGTVSDDERLEVLMPLVLAQAEGSFEHDARAVDGIAGADRMTAGARRPRGWGLLARFGTGRIR